MCQRLALCVLATLAAGMIAAAPASAQGRGSVVDATGGVSLVVGSSNARLCYERARVRSGSDEALARCDAAMREPLSSRNRLATYVNRSIVHAQRGELADALEDLEAAVSRAPDRPEVQLNFGDVYSRLGRWSEAEDAFTRAIELGTSRRHVAYFGRAIAREEQDDLEGAYADYMAAQAEAPDWRLPANELERFQVVAGGAAGGA